MPEGFEQGGGRSPEKDEQYRKNKGEFLTSVANPDEFQKDCDNIDSGRDIQKAEDWVGHWVDALKADTAKMEEIINAYKDGKHLGGYVLAKAIRVIEGKDSPYFEELHAHLSGLENPEGFSGGYVPNIAHELHDVKDKDPNAEFKLAALRNWHAKDAAISRVTDQEYLRKVAEQYRKKGEFGYDNDGAGALANITDQNYLAEIAQDEETDNFMRYAAVRRLTDTAILKKFADIPDREADQYFQEGGKRLHDTADKWTKPFHLGQLRKAARERLAELKKKK